MLLSALALALGLIGVTFRSLTHLPWGLIGSGAILFVTALILKPNPDPLAKTLFANYSLLGPGIMLLSLFLLMITNNLIRTEWGRRHEGLPTRRGLTALIQDPTFDERAAAVMTLGDYHDHKALPVIIQATHDADPAVHEIAMLALFDMAYTRAKAVEQAIVAAGEPRSIAPANLRWTPLEDRVRLLLAYASSFSGSAAYQYALKTLTDLGPIALPVLLKDLSLRDRDSPAILTSIHRKRAAHVLGQFGRLAESAVPSLINALDDPDRNTRKEIIIALGRIGDSRAIEPLMERLADDNRSIRAAAAEALEMLQSENPLPNGLDNSPLAR
jgi:HEAT repeat protein